MVWYNKFNMKKIVKGVLVDLLIVLLIINAVYSYFLSTKIYSRIFDITSGSFIEAIRNLDKESNDLYNENQTSAKDFLDLYKNSPFINGFINRSLNLFLSKNIVHIFMITKENNHFVYIYNAKEHVMPGFPFMPDKDELKKILKAYNEDKMLIYNYNKIFNIGFSLYYPIDIKQRYRALVVLDYSNKFTDFIDESFYIQRYISFSLLVLALVFLLYVGYIRLRENKHKLILYLDPLTGVFNRRYLKFVETIHKDYVIAMIDIDFFKQINDTYGHAVGDIAIKTVANIIRQSLRNQDIIIRYGGEEFLMLIRDPNDDFICNAILERIRKNIEKAYIYFDDKNINITVSIGALVDGKDLSLEERIKIADKFLYEAKNSGRNKIVCGRV